MNTKVKTTAAGIVFILPPPNEEEVEEEIEPMPSEPLELGNGPCAVVEPGIYNVTAQTVFEGPDKGKLAPTKDANSRGSFKKKDLLPPKKAKTKVKSQSKNS